MEHRPETKKAEISWAATLYPDAVDDDPNVIYDRFHVSDYQPIVDHFGNVLLQVDQSDYQGDTYVVYGDSWDGPLTYLEFGWGSCSGCDELLACSSYGAVDNLIESLRQSLQTFNTYDEFKQYLRQGGGRFTIHVEEYVQNFLPAVGFTSAEIEAIQEGRDT